MNKYIQNAMITFKQFLDEAKKKKIEKIQNKKGKLSKSEVMDVLNSQGGIGGGAIKKNLKNNPNDGPRSYKLDV